MTAAGRHTAAAVTGIIFHLAAIAAIGFSGLLSLKTYLPDEPIYEVSLMGSGSLRSAAEEAAASTAAVNLPQATAEPQPDDIIEEKIEPEPVVREKSQEKPQETTAQAHQSDSGQTAQKAGNGQGEGVGEGNGDGEKPGVGSGGALEGNAIQTPAVAPSLLKAVAPDYPPGPRRRGVEGTAYIRILLDKAGVPEAVEVMESAGDVYLDEAAQEAVEEWRFSPGLDSQGRPVRCYVQVPVAFKLD